MFKAILTRKPNDPDEKFLLKFGLIDELEKKVGSNPIVVLKEIGCD